MQVAMKTIALFKDFGKDHVYTLSEIAEIAKLNPDFIFLSMHQAIDLGQQISLDEGGFDNKDIADKGRALLIACKKALPFKVSYALPVLLKSSNGQSTKLTFLFCMPADQVENTDVIYQQGYYADFEANPSGNKKLKDSLPVWEKTREFASLRGRNDIRALILGSSYSGNYFALVEQMERDNVDGSIVVIDYNEIPLATLKTMGGFRKQDAIVRGGITKMDFPDKKFNVMYGDYILSCLHPGKVGDFFKSIAQNISPDGFIFLTLSCNNYYEANKTEEMPFAFNATVRNINGHDQEQYYRGTLSFYRSLAKQYGLKFKILKHEDRKDNVLIRDYYIVISPVKASPSRMLTSNSTRRAI